MKVSIIYFSKTGHSKKIAKAIGELFSIKPINIKSGEKPEKTDVMFVIGGIYGGQSMPELLNYISGLNSQNAAQAVLITSSATQKTKPEKIRDILTSNGIFVLEKEFMCRGSFLFMGFGHPNKSDIQEAVTFAAEIVK